MILISKHISTLHPCCFSKLWPPPNVSRPGWAHEVLSQFLSSFRKFVKSVVQWERRTDQWYWADWPIRGPVSPPWCLVSHWWHVLTMPWPLSPPSPPLARVTIDQHWPAWHVPHWSPLTTPLSPSGSSWPELTSGDQCWPGVWPPVCAAPLLSLMSPLRLPLLLIVMQMSPLCSQCPGQRFVPHRPRMPLVSFEMEYSLRNGKQTEDWINYWSNGTWNLHHLAPESRDRGSSEDLPSHPGQSSK